MRVADRRRQVERSIIIVVDRMFMFARLAKRPIETIFHQLILINIKYKHHQMCLPPHHESNKSWDGLMALQVKMGSL